MASSGNQNLNLLNAQFIINSRLRIKKLDSLQKNASQETLALIETIKSFKLGTGQYAKKVFLLNSYLRYHKKWWGNGIKGVDKAGKTPLIHAVLTGDLDTVRWLCNRQKERRFFHQNPNPNHLDKDGKNALMYAIQLGHTEIVEELIKVTNVNIPSQPEKYLPLWYAVQEEKATMPMVAAIAQRTKKVASNGFLFALVRSKRSTKHLLAEVTDFVLDEVAKSLKTEGTVDIKNYKRIGLRILQVALREQKFDVIEHLFSSKIQKAFNINTPDLINSTWDTFLNYVINVNEWANQKSPTVQKKAASGIYEFIKYFLKLAAEQNNTVFSRNKHWEGLKSKLFYQALQNKDDEMQTLLFPVKVPPFVPINIQFVVPEIPPFQQPSIIVNSPQRKTMAAIMQTQEEVQPLFARTSGYLTSNGDKKKSIFDLSAAFYSQSFCKPTELPNSRSSSLMLKA